MLRLISNKFFWLISGVFFIAVFISNTPTPPAGRTGVPATTPPSSREVAAPAATQEPPETAAPNLEPTPDPTAVEVAQSDPAPTSTVSLVGVVPCPPGMTVPEGAPVWLTVSQRTFTGALNRSFPSGVTLTGREAMGFCETTQTGPFGPEWFRP